MGELFGTDGVRGVAGEYPLDPPTVFRLGRALVRAGRRRVLIGRDTRASGPWVSSVLDAGIRSENGSAVQAGILTTPAVAVLTGILGLDAGVAVSASHNPYQDNGIKIFSGDLRKISDEEEKRIEEALLQDTALPSFSRNPGDETGDDIGAMDEELAERYAEFLLGKLRLDSLSQLRIVLDCANGAAYRIAPSVFQRLGADVLVIEASPDGRNINRQCGAVHPERMAGTVVDGGASVGAAFDGDADRVIFCDGQGRIFDGDHVLLILARYLKRKGGLRSLCVVTTVMANKGLEVALRDEGLKMVRTPVGDKYVMEEMVRGRHDLGGEPSGHVILGEDLMAGDGILTALKITEIMRETGSSLGELADGFEKFPQILVNVAVREKLDFSKIAPIREEIESARRELGDAGRVLVRYSGTEPLVRIMLEGRHQEEIVRYAGNIAERFRAALG